MKVFCLFLSLFFLSSNLAVANHENHHYREEKLDFDLDEVIDVKYFIDDFKFETFIKLKSEIILFGDYIFFFKGQIVGVKYKHNKKTLLLVDPENPEKVLGTFYCRDSKDSDEPCRIYKHY